MLPHTGHELKRCGHDEAQAGTLIHTIERRATQIQDSFGPLRGKRVIRWNLTLTPLTYGHIHDEIKALIERSCPRSSGPGVVDVQFVKAAPFPKRLIERHAQDSVVGLVDVGEPGIRATNLA